MIGKLLSRLSSPAKETRQLAEKQQPDEQELREKVAELMEKRERLQKELVARVASECDGLSGKWIVRVLGLLVFHKKLSLEGYSLEVQVEELREQNSNVNELLNQFGRDAQLIWLKELHQEEIRKLENTIQKGLAHLKAGEKRIELQRQRMANGAQQSEEEGNPLRLRELLERQQRECLEVISPSSEEVRIRRAAGSIFLKNVEQLEKSK